MILPDATAKALSDARRLAGMGIPIFCARLKGDGEPDRRDKRWQRWQDTEPGQPSLDAISAWQPGDALCAVMGVACDALDPDLYKPDGAASLGRLRAAIRGDEPEVWWKVDTPSGGQHFLIDRTGLGSHNGIMPGLDIKGGKPDGSGRGFIFIPPTMRPSKVTGEVAAYRAAVPLRKMNGHGNIGALRDYLAALLESSPDELVGGNVGRADPDVLREACFQAGDGDQRAALMRYVSELEKRGYAKSDILLLLRSICTDPRWVNYPSRYGPWYPARGGNPDRYFLGLFHKPGVIIPDGKPDELAFLVDWEPEPASPRRAPIRLTATVPDYPVVSGVLGRLVRSAKHLPPALVGGAGLAALAAACGRWSLRMPDSSYQYPVVWVPLLAPRGAGKSPALDLAFESLRQLDHDAWHAYRKEMSEWAKMSKEEKATGSRPVDPSILVDDFTMEHLARALASGEERACVVSDEMNGWLRGLGRYGRGGGAAEVSRMLSLWSSSPWKYGRVTNDVSLLIERPVVSVVGGLQPHLQGLLGDDETGMRPRWLPHYVSSWKAKWGEDRAPSSWINRIAEMYCRDGGVLGLNGKALDAWTGYRDEWHERMDSAAISETVAGALSKADLQLARVALILGVAAGAHDGDALDAKWVHEAARIIEYCIGVWAALPSPEEFALTEADRIMRDKVRKLLAWVQQRGGRASRSEVYDSKVAGVNSPDDVTKLLKAYGRMYPGCVGMERTGKRGPKTEVVLAPGA